MLKTIKKRLKNQKGLTLVELLAVIVILGIIAAIAVPAIGNLIQNSKRDAAVSNAIQVINSTKLALTAGETASSITTAEDISDYINEFTNPFEKTPISLGEIAIDLTDEKNPAVNMTHFGCASGSETAATLAKLTADNARDTCVAP